MATPPSGTSGYGRDNITGGDRFNLDLGVTPDMGDLVQNMTVVNQMLDDAQSKFDAMAQSIGSTTQRMNELSRATELYIQQTGRIKADFSAIVQSGQAIASTDLGAAMPGAGGGEGGGGGITFRGAAQEQQILMQQEAASVGQQDQPMEDFGGEAGPPLGTRLMQSAPNLFFLEQTLRDAAQKGSQLITRVPIFGKHVQARISLTHTRLREAARNEEIANYLENNATGNSSELTRAVSSLRNGVPASEVLGDLKSRGLVSGAGIKTLTGVGESAAESAATEGGLGALSGPLIAAYAAYKAGKFLYNTAQQSQVYSSLTGGTSSWNTLGYENRILKMSLSPFINSQQARQIVMGTLQAGYVGKEQDDIMNYLAYNVKKGLTDIGAGLKLYETAVSDAGGSISTLNIGLKSLRDTAIQTNSSVQTMTQNFQQQLTSQVALGIPGSSATVSSAYWAKTFANAPSKALENYGGPNLGDIFLQSMLAGPLKTNVLNVPYKLGGMSPFQQYKATYGAIQQYLTTNLGLHANMTPRQILGYMNGGWLRANAPVLAGPLGVDPNDLNTMSQVISGYLSNAYGPDKILAQQKKEFYGKRNLTWPQRINEEAKALGVSSAMGFKEWQRTLSSDPLHLPSMADYRKYLGSFQQNLRNEGTPLKQWYADYIGRTGSTLPWLQGLLADDQTNQNIVSYGGKYYSIYSFLTNGPKGVNAMQELMTGKAKLANVTRLSGDQKFSWSQQHGGIGGQVFLTPTQRRGLSFTETVASLAGTSPEAISNKAPQQVEIVLKSPADQLLKFVGPNGGKYLLMAEDAYRKQSGKS